ncbi:hypothetical protein ACFPU0_14265 [Pseudomonas sp. GCM10022186]|uniref:hypothetical protein n=1 Tax=Pseudomonas sp. GCM10022186 TaxID=3252650 RepID=UPI003605D218
MRKQGGRVSEYHGIRWFKTDFQVQTPEDNKHWADDDLRLLSPRRPIVNGAPDEADTDLAYALEVAQGRGVRLAAGGLDRADTATAVLDIMEGSAEAFKRRFDKYHF